MKFNQKDFWAAVVERKEKRGLEWSDISKSVKIPSQTIFRMGQGRIPNLLHYAKMCEWMNAPLSKFFTKKVKRNANESK